MWARRLLLLVTQAVQPIPDHLVTLGDLGRDALKDRYERKERFRIADVALPEGVNGLECE